MEPSTPTYTQDDMHSWLLDTLKSFHTFIIQAAQAEDDQVQYRASQYEVCIQKGLLTPENL